MVDTEEQKKLIRKLNFRMSGIRQSIEHMYGLLFNLFHLLQMKRQFKILHDRKLSYRLGLVCFFLLNCYTCLNGSACNSMFNTFPPTLEQYLPVDEELEKYSDNDDFVYNFYVIDNVQLDYW